MITVVDYGMGNLRNVRRAFEELGEDVLVTGDAGRVAAAGRIILPGVGAFGEAVQRIDALGLRPVLSDHVAAGKPLLGICLGMQLLFESSEESPGAAGLALLPGSVRRFVPLLKVPHIGWNDVVPTAASTLLPGPGACCYFVHSFFVPASDAAVAMTTYGAPFVSAVQQGNLFGVQFHPEKSQADGREILTRFLGVR